MFGNSHNLLIVCDRLYYFEFDFNLILYYNTDTSYKFLQNDQKIW